MANSLEVRAPILDHNVIEFAAGIAPELKYRRGEKKYILKQTFKEILPHDILYRKKMGFSVPLAQWLQGELKELAGNFLFNKNAGINHFFKPEPVLEIWEQHQKGKRNYSTILWGLLMFEMWYQGFMD